VTIQNKFFETFVQCLIVVIRITTKCSLLRVCVILCPMMTQQNVQNAFVQILYGSGYRSIN